MGRRVRGLVLQKWCHKQIFCFSPPPAPLQRSVLPRGAAGCVASKTPPAAVLSALEKLFWSGQRDNIRNWRKQKSRSSVGIFSEQEHPSLGGQVQDLYLLYGVRSLLQLPLTSSRAVSQNLPGPVLPSPSRAGSAGASVTKGSDNRGRRVCLSNADLEGGYASLKAPLILSQQLCT